MKVMAYKSGLGVLQCSSNTPLVRSKTKVACVAVSCHACRRPVLKLKIKTFDP